MVLEIKYIIWKLKGSWTRCMIHVIDKSQSLSWHETGSVLLKSMVKSVNLYPLKIWPYMLRLFFL